MMLWGVKLFVTYHSISTFFFSDTPSDWYTVIFWMLLWCYLLKLLANIWCYMLLTVTWKKFYIPQTMCFWGGYQILKKNKHRKSKWTVKNSHWCNLHFNMSVCNMKNSYNVSKMTVIRWKTVLKVEDQSNQYERYITDQVSKILLIKNT